MGHSVAANAEVLVVPASVTHLGVSGIVRRQNCVHSAKVYVPSYPGGVGEFDGGEIEGQGEGGIIYISAHLESGSVVGARLSFERSVERGLILHPGGARRQIVGHSYREGWGQRRLGPDIVDIHRVIDKPAATLVGRPRTQNRGRPGKLAVLKVAGIGKCVVVRPVPSGARLIAEPRRRGAWRRGVV